MTPELARVVDRALAAPYYRDKLGAWVCEPTWSMLPFTTKTDLRAAYPFGLLAVAPDAIATYHESSGTSGEPTPTFYTEADWDDIASRFARNAVGLCSSDTVLVKTPYSMVTTAHQMHRAARSKGALVIPADNRCANMPYSKVIRLLKDLRVTVVWCLPSEALIWAAAARAHGLDPRRDFPALRAFIVAGEPLGSAKRRRLEAMWGARVFEDYGSTETGSLAGDCERGRLHAWTDRLLFELIGADGSVSTRGIGELAITPLYREAQPLLRYRVGDRVELRPGGCECGSPFPVIRVLGREESAIQIGDVAILPSAIEETVFRLPVSDDVTFWRARASDTMLDVEIECDDDTVARRLELEFRDDLAIGARVRCVAAGAIFPTARLTEISRPLKPRHVFAAGDDWNQGLSP